MSTATELTGTGTRPQGWSVEAFAAFWADPDPSLVPDILTDDVLGYWPGQRQPVQGKAAYTERIAAILTAVPNFKVAVAEHAQAGEYTFIRWIATGTGPAGPFTETGIDRIRVVDGLVAENYICPADSARFAAAIFGAGTSAKAQPPVS